MSASGQVLCAQPEMVAAAASKTHDDLDSGSRGSSFDMYSIFTYALKLHSMYAARLALSAVKRGCFKGKLT